MHIHVHFFSWLLLLLLLLAGCCFWCGVAVVAVGPLLLLLLRLNLCCVRSCESHSKLKKAYIRKTVIKTFFPLFISTNTQEGDAGHRRPPDDRLHSLRDRGVPLPARLRRAILPGLRVRLLQGQGRQVQRAPGQVQALRVRGKRAGISGGKNVVSFIKYARN